MLSSWSFNREALIQYRGAATKWGAGFVGFVAAAMGLHTGYTTFVMPIVAHDVSGRWCVDHVITHATHMPFMGMKLEFHFDLRQEKNEIKGVGRKHLVNGERPPPLEASWLEVRSGMLTGDRITLAFTEKSDANPNRTVNGTIDWKIKDNKLLEGTFDTSGASAKGSSTARRC